MTRRARLFKLEMWVPALYVLVATAIICGLLFFKLGTLTGGLSAGEIAAAQSSSSIKQIQANPINAPYKLARLAGVRVLKQTSAFSLRTTSAVFALISAAVFYYILKHWLTKRMAALGTLLFISSSWFLHTGRSAADSVSQWFVLIIVAWGIWVMRTKRYELALLSGAVLAAIGLYVPAMVWALLAAIFWQRPRLRNLIKDVSWRWRLGAIVLALALIAPLVYGLITEPSLILPWLGLADNLPALTTFIRNLVSVPLNLLVFGPSNSELWLGTVPVLDVFGSAMAAIGTYAYYFQRKLDRVKLLLAVLTAGCLFTALGGPINLTIILPFVYMLIATGITLMAQQWFTVFPRNPLARAVGLVLITSAILLSVYYQTNNYFVAWPNSPETKSSYQNLLQ